MDRALDGIDVIDLGQVYHGPYCGLMLSYLGADVVRIEPPDGEPLRGRVESGEPGPLVFLNSSKDGITLNLKRDRGKELLRELADEADVLIENFGVGTMDGLDLGYESLSERNPELVYAHGSGYGEHGPYRDLPAMDLTVQAMGGVMDVTGFPDAPPTKAGIAVSDFLGGIHLTAGILAALYQREFTGEGQFVEVSMHDTVFPTLASPLGSKFEGREAPPRTGNRHSGLAQCPYNVYAVENGYVAIFCIRDRHWDALVELFDRSELATDPRYETNTERSKRIDEVDGMVSEWVGNCDRDDLVDRLQSAGVPCAPVKELDEVAADPHLRERGMIEELDHPDFGTIPVPGPPIRLSESKAPDVEPAPTKGEHNEQVYSERFGLTQAEIEALDADGVI
ncbi:MAG: CaiB/BaiF CoA transferase family protein [Salinirussus sp.]